MVKIFNLLPLSIPFVTLFILGSVCGFYYSPIRELRSFASSRFNRLFSTAQRRSSSPIPCVHPCKGVSVARPDVRAIPNGCGPSHFPDFLNDLIPYKDKFKDCCNKHDLDYGTCNKPKVKSDRQFFKCLYNKIQEDRLSGIVQSFRIIAAQGYYSAVDIFGCEAWVNSQMNACTCLRRRHKKPNLNYKKYAYI